MKWKEQSNISNNVYSRMPSLSEKNMYNAHISYPYVYSILKSLYAIYIFMFNLTQFCAYKILLLEFLVYIVKFPSGSYSVSHFWTYARKIVTTDPDKLLCKGRCVQGDRFGGVRQFIRRAWPRINFKCCGKNIHVTFKWKKFFLNDML